jgi:tetratricopeptide (TPR) repeat protein
MPQEERIVIDRFKFLEFPDDSTCRNGADALSGEIKRPDRDHVYYLAEAEKKYREADFEGALRSYSKALTLDSSLISAWEGQVRCLIDLDEYREAEVWLNKALGLYPRNPGLLSARALSLSLSGFSDQAMAASDEAFSLKTSGLTFGWLDRGAVLLSRGREDTARSNFEKALEENPDDWFFLMRVGMIYQRYGKNALALDYYLRASALSPAIPFLWYRMGRACLSMGHLERAANFFERSLEISPHYQPAREALIETRKKNRGITEMIMDFFRKK